MKDLKNLIKYLNRNQYIAYSVGENTIYMSKYRIFKSKKRRPLYLPFVVNKNPIMYKDIKL